MKYSVNHSQFFLHILHSNSKLFTEANLLALIVLMQQEKMLNLVKMVDEETFGDFANTLRKTNYTTSVFR